jgi:immune inhibitor A
MQEGEKRAAAQGETRSGVTGAYAFYTNIGITGPAFNKLGGVRIGNSDY